MSEEEWEEEEEEFNEEEANKEAYDRGYDIGLGVGIQAREDGQKVSDLEEISAGFMDNYTQYDSYANSILPDLRALAGCKDSGVGTYGDCTEEQDFIVDDLVNKFWEGIGEGIEKGLSQDMPKEEKREEARKELREKLFRKRVEEE